MQCTERNREKNSAGMMRRACSSPKTGKGITEKTQMQVQSFPQDRAQNQKKQRHFMLVNPILQILLWFYDLLFRVCQSLILVGWTEHRTRDEVEREEQGQKIWRKVTPGSWVCTWDCRNQQAKQHRRQKSQSLVLRAPLVPGWKRGGTNTAKSISTSPKSWLLCFLGSYWADPGRNIVLQFCWNFHRKPSGASSGWKTNHRTSCSKQLKPCWLLSFHFFTELDTPVQSL